MSKFIRFFHLQEKTVQKLIKFSFALFLFSVPFSYLYSLGFLDKYKSYTSFSLYNLYLIDIAALLFILANLLESFLHKKSFLASFWGDSHTKIEKILIGFCLFILISSFWSGSPFLSVFWGVRTLLICIASICTIRLLNIETYRNLFFRTIVVAGILESIIIIFQFIFQRSVGLYILGEAHLGPDILGLAHTTILGQSFLRAYGTLPHPNIMGGFLLFTIITTYWVHTLKYRNILIITQAIALGLTFSRSAILGLILIILVNYLFSRKSKLVDFNWSKTKLYFFIGIALFFLTILVRSPIQKIINGTDPSTRLRLEYAEAAYSRFLASPIFGRGWGTGPIELPAFSNFPFYAWELQPVHNIYLLTISDLGVIGLIILILFIFRAVKSKSNNGPAVEGKDNIWKSLFIAYLFIGIFDHYLLTLPQGIFLFFVSAFLVCYVELDKSTKRREKIPRLG